MPLSEFNPANYNQLLDAKVQHLKNLLKAYTDLGPEVFSSPKQGFRMRAEFRIWHEGDDTQYIMFKKGDSKTHHTINDFPIGSEIIQKMMPALREAVLTSNILREKLFQVEFLTTLSGECLITLIYHKALNESWAEAARELEKTLKCSIIGRSRKQKLVISQDFVTETLMINDDAYSYQQVEGSFTQPNAEINQQMISWALSCCNEQQTDMLELYCGNGNFTIPLSQKFRQVLATEISKTSVNSAQVNLAANKSDNIKICRMSSEEFTQALNGERAFRRLEQAGVSLDEYNFSTVLVDPPRAGLDDGTTHLISRFDQIIYISCNPVTLAANLEQLCKTHSITKLALFDQFPYTDHIETGILLNRK